MAKEDRQKHCTHCGSIISEADNFCGDCGVNLKELPCTILESKRKYRVGWSGVFVSIYLLLVIILLGKGLSLNNSSRASEFAYDFLTARLSIFLILFHCVLLIDMYCKNLRIRILHYIFSIEFVSFLVIASRIYVSNKSGAIFFIIVSFIFVLPSWIYFYNKSKYQTT